MKLPSLQYYEVRINASHASIDLVSLNDLLRLIHQHQIRDVFISRDDDAGYYGVFLHQVYMRCNNQGFQTLEDYQHALAAHFPDAALYYAAIAQGYHKYQDYELVTQAGITDRAIFDEMQKGGFIEGYNKDYRLHTSVPEAGLSSQQADAYQTPAFQNPYQLYNFATTNGFESFSDFKKAIDRGFSNANILAAAESRGFYTHTDYEEAMKKGFENYKDLAVARQKKVRDYHDLQRLLDLDFSGAAEATFDKKLLLTLLSKIDGGKKISINKLKDLLKKSAEEYRYADTGDMPEWFTISLETEEQLMAFMHKDERVKEYGSYDADGEFFESHRFKDRKVMIDGSNVAHNGQPAPMLSNVVKMVNHLKLKGFTDISIINDASLRHKVTDAETLPILKEQVVCQDAPADAPADIFIIQYVKKHHCLLVSNDNFREWKMLDPWIAENIDYYRLTFMIKGEDVLMPDLK